MKLATLRNHHRDGQLVVVSRDLQRMRAVPECATLQAALDQWDAMAPVLQRVADELAAGQGPFEAFRPEACAAPLPRAYQWLDASAYLNHVELVRRARGADMPEELRREPLMYQGGSDDFLGAHDPIEAADEAFGIDLEAEVIVITGDVPIGCSAEAALGRVRLVGLANDVTLRHLVPPEIAKGFGFLQSKPATALSPVLATPDELGPHWRAGKLHLPLLSELNGERLGAPDAGVDMDFDFGRLIAHAARTRRLVAGTIVGSGTVSNRDPAAGVSCLAERRVREQLGGASALTPFLRSGDRVRIEMRDPDGHSLFGAITQTVRTGVAA
ncbi:fumarylacetoacetate (FAA) hydrolase [Acidovorax soli]|uniref:Fumarylacetoacetate (FAA) hydrolase n=1 Tax=Acidovorax soli TaxID=592050 RepID=A0A7X0PBP6_9BURK|nr:fumarylacetoacetate hydrolase family protein [Acidovorax soli]MBB6558972.1 fumarylacetoacetate (FAA) hydrolase [Acidovorax soli]